MIHPGGHKTQASMGAFQGENSHLVILLPHTCICLGYHDKPTHKENTTGSLKCFTNKSLTDVMWLFIKLSFDTQYESSWSVKASDVCERTLVNKQHHHQDWGTHLRGSGMKVWRSYKNKNKPQVLNISKSTVQSIIQKKSKVDLVWKEEWVKITICGCAKLVETCSLISVKTVQQSSKKVW